ncbi:MAG: thermonuclease family protein [Parvibaculaceae bacterium]|nr:thermonuclease family protein [Parvibaculaceae bacterium]
MRLPRWKFTPAAALLVLAYFIYFPFGDEIRPVGRVTAIDGDTIKFDGRRVRLWGIDAPEKNQFCEKDGESHPAGLASGIHLASLIKSDQMYCRADRLDRYGREIAVCWQAGSIISLNAKMIQDGAAYPAPQYDWRSLPYVLIAALSNIQGKGLYRFDHCQSPAEFRRSTQ